MSTHNLDAMFKPTSVALIGASNRPLSVGQVVMHNLIDAGFAGLIMPVNPREKYIRSVVAYPDIASLPIAPDMAIVCIPPKAVLASVKELIVRGTRAIVILTAGLELVKNAKGQTLQDEVVAAACAAGVRILGPNCLGLLVPSIGLNASFSPLMALKGRVAFVSHSGALCTAIIDWARVNNIGFSHFISIGNAKEVDVGDIIEYLGECPETSSIVLYLESITNAEKFVQVARRVSRKKPIIAIKSGASDLGAQAAASHTGALAGADNVYDAALLRAGVLRVQTFSEIFETTATLASIGDWASEGTRSEDITILTNGGGAGVLAVDALATHGGSLTKLSDGTKAKLDAILPETWSHGNPVDILGDATVERYDEVLEVLLDAPEVDSLLIIHCPLAVVSATEVAKRVTKRLKNMKKFKPVFTCWVGGSLVQESRDIFTANGIRKYETPENAIRAHMRLVKFQRNQQMIEAARQAGSVDVGFKPDIKKVRGIIDASVGKGQEMLGEHEAKSILKAYGIPVAETRTTKTPEESAKVASEIGYPVVLKIMSDDISHKSDVGGVVLDLNAEADVLAAAKNMLSHIREAMPKARLSGFTVQNMIKRPHAIELIAGLSTDPLFGPVVLFGQGGVSVEVVKDSAVTLAPINHAQALDLVERTRVSKLLAGYRDCPAADKERIGLALCSISRLVEDFPEIKELDINPLLADAHGVIALDARVRVQAIGKTEDPGVPQKAQTKTVA